MDDHHLQRIGVAQPHASTKADRAEHLVEGPDRLLGSLQSHCGVKDARPASSRC